MARSLKKEIWRAFHNPMIYTALIIGLVLALFDVIQSKMIADEWLFQLDKSYYLPNGVKWGQGSVEGNGLFNNWMGAGLNNLSQMIFYMLVPLLAAMSYGWTEVTDRKSGYRNQLCIRESKKNRLISRYLAAFVAGGATVAIPLVVNFLIDALLLPAAVPSPASMLTPMSVDEFGSLLFFEHPWMFVLLSIVLMFFWGGAFCCVSLTAGMVMNHKILTVFLPFLGCFALEMAYQTGIFHTKTEFSPFVLMHLVAMRGTKGSVIFGEIILMIILSFAIFLWVGNREEGL